jgi:hypothetical protein
MAADENGYDDSIYPMYVEANGKWVRKINDVMCTCDAGKAPVQQHEKLSHNGKICNRYRTYILRVNKLKDCTISANREVTYQNVLGWMNKYSAQQYDGFTGSHLSRVMARQFEEEFRR